MTSLDEFLQKKSDETSISIPIANEAKTRKSINKAEVKSKVKELLLDPK